ncbi:MAG: hypothetical protein D6698_09780 [Gammaproteobacteria bacterium]|nr:MAG: hypothetical protein D6698_09780 [Gammaproteobacteria bacterium]
METWEKILLAAMAVLLVFIFRPGIKASIQMSRTAPKDWPGFLLPIALVVLFVIFLLSTV